MTTADDGLPRVPVPSLHDSTERFLTWCKPLVSASQFETTRQAVAQLLEPGSPIHDLQHSLEQRELDGHGDSWLDDFWDERYLGRRDRIALNANFFFLLKASHLGQVERAAQLLRSIVDHKLRLDAGLIPTTTRRGEAQSMAQLTHLYSTTRIPGVNQDTTRTTPRQRHVAVLFHGHTFRLDVLDESGRPFGHDALTQALRAVLTAGTTAGETDTSLGPLTTGPRSTWATDRMTLIALDPRNARSLDVLESALLCLCLDDDMPRSPLEACQALLHGDTRNRWFDKALSLVVFADGTAGLNCEHARLDGSMVAEWIDAIHETPGDQRPRAADASGTPAVQRLRFLVDAPMRAAIHTATASFAHQVDDTATALLPFTAFGTSRIKELNASPDAFVQLALQLANHRARGRTGATYESIGTRHFHHGRTEAMRVVTPESMHWVATMDDTAATRSDVIKDFRAAADAHLERARQCRNGQAPEQHLWELGMLRRRLDGSPLDELALFHSPGWLAMRDDDLSTSSVGSDAIDFFGFGPTSDRCIGVSYLLLADRFNFHLSASGTTDLAAFSDHLATVLTEMEAILRPQV